MAWIFCNGKPISQQIADKITIDILTGKILTTQRLPSPEKMCDIVGTSVNVIALAYNELLNEKIVFMHDDLYIINNDLSFAKKRRERIANESITSFLNDMSELGIENEEMLFLLRNALISKMEE